MAAVAPAVVAAPQVLAASNGVAGLLTGEVGTITGFNIANSMAPPMPVSHVIPEFMRIALRIRENDYRARRHWADAYRQYRRLHRRGKVGDMGPRKILSEFHPWDGEWFRREHIKSERAHLRSSWEEREKRAYERDYKRTPAWCKDERVIADHMAHEALQQMKNAVGIGAQRAYGYPR